MITITTQWLNLIKAVLAYPYTDNLTLTDDQIKDLCIFPAMRQYFIRFPIRVNVQQQISRNLTIAFPDELTYGVVDLRVTGKTYGAGSQQGTSFWDIVRFYQLGGGALTGRGLYGGKKGYNPNSLRQTYFDLRQMGATIQNEFTTIDYRVDLKERTIDVWSNSVGALLIGWAKHSSDFEDVKFEQQLNVIKLCQANLMKHLADASDIGEDTSIDVKINSDKLRSNAKDLKTEVWDLWNQYPFPVYLRKT